VANLIEAVEAYLDAQGALDNRELMGLNAAPYEEMLRACKRAYEVLDDALHAAKLAAAPGATSVPFGMALVPIEPTQQMCQEGQWKAQEWPKFPLRIVPIWKAMLEAAPVVTPLTLETAEEARKDREHAEAYYRQAERLLTANEATLRAERDQLLEQLAAAQRDVIELRAAAPAVAPADRERFEAYFAESRRSRGAGKRPNFARLADSTYADDHTQRHWWTWQQAGTFQAPGATHEERE
jgi:hypothetical protein